MMFFTIILSYYLVLFMLWSDKTLLNQIIKIFLFLFLGTGLIFFLNNLKHFFFIWLFFSLAIEILFLLFLKKESLNKKNYIFFYVITYLSVFATLVLIIKK